MSRRKTNKKPIIILLVLMVLIAALLGGMIWFVSTHFFVGGKAYPKDAQVLDLRDQTLTVEKYEAIRQELPGCEILWSVPFQDSAYPDDTTELSVRTLSDSDLEQIAYFTELKKVDAAGCLDYDRLMELKELYPAVELSYTVTIGGKEYAQDAAAVVCPEGKENSPGRSIRIVSSSSTV